MPTREEMHSLGQEMVRSYEARTSDVAVIRQDVAAQLHELDRAHNAMAQQLRAGLAHVVAQRESDTSTQLQELHKGHAGSQAAWQEMTATMQATRKGVVAGAEAPPAAEEVRQGTRAATSRRAHRR